MTDFRDGYTSKWRIMRVDKDTWGDVEEIGNVESVSVKKSCTDDVPLIEQGNATITMPLGSEFETGWYRIEMLSGQNGTYDRHPIATLLFEGYKDTDNYNALTVQVDGYSVLKPVADRKMVLGDYLNKGLDGAEWCTQLIKKCVPSPVQVTCEGSFLVDTYRVFDAGCTYLKAVWEVLDAVQWCIKIDGYGNIYLGPRPKEPSLILDKVNASLLIPGIDRTLDVSEVPNRYYVTSGDGAVAVAVNDDPDSRTSYSRRGWYKDETADNPIRANGETLEACAERLLEEASTLVRTYRYTREYDPDTRPFDIVWGKLPSHIYSTLRVMTQQLDCGKHGVTVQEEAGEEVAEWIPNR